MARGRRSLLFWVALALTVAAVFPLAIGLWQLRTHRNALLGQVQRLQIFAASTAANRIGAYVETLRREAVTASRNPLLDDLGAAAAHEVLAGLIQERPELLAAGVLPPAGEPIVLAQRRDAAATVARALADEPGELLRLAGLESRWLRLQVPMVERARDGVEPNRLVLLARADALREVLREANQIGDAQTVLVDRQPRALLGGQALMMELPASLLQQVESEKLGGGAGRYVDAEGEEIVAAHFPVAGTPWLVISRQPRAVADAARRRMERATLSATVGALFIATMLSLLGYRLLVRPMRRLVKVQAEVAGLEAPAGGSEIAQLESTFGRLMQIEQDREVFGEVFLGRYKVMGKLGRGGSGTVFNGFDPVLQRPVALKAVPLEGKDDIVAKLQSEAVHLARLNHPHIVSVFDFARKGDTAYIAMEKVDGLSLDQYLRHNKGLQMREGVAISVAVTDALVAAHSVNLVHGDLKPGNILLSRTGDVKVADFGTARIVRQQSDVGDRLIGTAGYVAPEVLRRQGATRTSDLFSLGVVMYQIFTSRRPFGEGKIPDILRRTLDEEPVDVRELRSMLPLELTRLVMRLLAKDPQDRPASATAVAEELEGISAGLGDDWKIDIEDVLLDESRRKSLVAAEYVTAYLGD